MRHNDSSVLRELLREILLSLSALHRTYISHARVEVTNVKGGVSSANRLLGVHVFVIDSFLCSSWFSRHGRVFSTSGFTGSIFYPLRLIHREWNGTIDSPTPSVPAGRVGERCEASHDERSAPPTARRKSRRNEPQISNLRERRLSFPFSNFAEDSRGSPLLVKKQ